MLYKFKSPEVFSDIPVTPFNIINHLIPLLSGEINPDKNNQIRVQHGDKIDLYRFDNGNSTPGILVHLVKLSLQRLARILNAETILYEPFIFYKDQDGNGLPFEETHKGYIFKWNGKDGHEIICPKGKPIDVSERYLFTHLLFLLKFESKIPIEVAREWGSANSFPSNPSLYRLTDDYVKHLIGFNNEV